MKKQDQHTDSTPARIYLSPPHIGTEELELVKEAFATNWIAPLGPHVDAFERELADYIGVPYAAALSSGTAGIHLAFRILGLQPGEEVICSTLTFSATANPVLYEGARPIFIDCDTATWNMDPDLLRQTLQRCAATGRLPRVAIVVDLYGQCADYDRILAICKEYDVTVIEDAAEALGATYRGKKAGVFGKCAVFSFNGNKIITTSGGGMLVSDDGDLIERARFLATQARDPAPHYQHSAIGYNYRLSNVLAAIGRGQLRLIDQRVAQRRQNWHLYRSALADIPGISFMPQASYGESNHWLTCIVVEPEKFGATREDIRLALEAENIEARPIWKPLHMQPVFKDAKIIGGDVAEAIFEKGLCLPSGSSLHSTDLERVAAVVRSLADH
jgi:dTDP-4-amino-4,6-dideoxygalactose transaminase